MSSNFFSFIYLIIIHMLIIGVIFITWGVYQNNPYTRLFHFVIGIMLVLSSCLILYKYYKNNNNKSCTLNEDIEGRHEP